MATDRGPRVCTRDTLSLPQPQDQDNNIYIELIILLAGSLKARTQTFIKQLPQVVSNHFSLPIRSTKTLGVYRAIISEHISPPPTICNDIGQAPIIGEDPADLNIRQFVNSSPVTHICNIQCTCTMSCKRLKNMMPSKYFVVAVTCNTYYNCTCGILCLPTLNCTVCKFKSKFNVSFSSTCNPSL